MPMESMYNADFVTISPSTLYIVHPLQDRITQMGNVGFHRGQLKVAWFEPRNWIDSPMADVFFLTETWKADVHCYWCNKVLVYLSIPETMFYSTLFRPSWYFLQLIIHSKGKHANGYLHLWSWRVFQFYVLFRASRALTAVGMVLQVTETMGVCVYIYVGDNIYIYYLIYIYTHTPISKYGQSKVDWLHMLLPVEVLWSGHSLDIWWFYPHRFH